MKKVFIVNPASGNGKAGEIAKEIKGILDNSGEEYEMHYTNAPREAIDIAMKYNKKKERYLIYSVGGDGTLFEVVNGIHDSNNVLGIIPAGTGNDFVKTINNDDEITYVDLCKMNDYYFINIASVGIDADIAHNKERMSALHIPRSMQYNASIVDTFFRFNSPHITATLPDRIYDQDITILAICNGRFYGGGFQIAPNASYNDGMFDIYLVDKLSKFKIPGLILKLVKGTHEESKYVHKLSSDKITIHSDKPLNCNLDGEIFLLNDMEFEITNKKIPVYTANDQIKKLCKSKGLYK
ncbi:MAG: diacylglycerol kinase family lipid kinase [Bacilli bacterium]|nr:diacylglycerol kinase family lipid kinase [Bacilli bacterium]